jgi:ABC-type uncharacterized transport system auxiliary subunit
MMLSFLLAGCFNLGKPSPVINPYALEYKPPVFSEAAAVDEAMVVGRFDAAQAISGFAMIYRPEPFRYSAYNDCRWAAKPADMVADSLTRDLRESGLFNTVFSYHQSDFARFRLDGTLVEFYEDDERESKATITLNIILSGRNRQDLARKTILQKTYRVSEHCEKTPKGLARGMSKAMESLSRQISTEISSAIRKDAMASRVPSRN